MITEKTGNIFNTKCQTIVNTINTVGFMGKGIALEMQLRYPEMCDIYKILCGVEESFFETSQIAPANTNQKEHSKSIYADLIEKYGSAPRIEIGRLWLYTNTENRWILNFPTKIRWQNPSRIEYLEAGLQKFLDTYQQKEVTSIAFPILGGALGGLPEDLAIATMITYLSRCESVDIEIWHYDNLATDELYVRFRETLLEMEPDTLVVQMRKAGYARIPAEKIFHAIQNPNICTVSQMMEVKGLGYQTVKKVYDFLNAVQRIEESQLQFDFNQDVG